MFCDANCVQKINKSVQWPHSLAIWLCLQLSLFMVFWNVLIASLWAFIIVVILWSVVMAVWYDLSLSLLCVIKVALSAKASAVLLYAISQWPGIHCKTVILVFVINICFNFWNFWTSVVLGDYKLLIACTAGFESEGGMGEFITLVLAWCLSYHLNLWLDVYHIVSTFGLMLIISPHPMAWCLYRLNLYLWLDAYHIASTFGLMLIISPQPLAWCLSYRLNLWLDSYHIASIFGLMLTISPQPLALCLSYRLIKSSFAIKGYSQVTIFVRLIERWVLWWDSGDWNAIFFSIL
jgi:hypothetical protein